MYDFHLAEEKVEFTFSNGSTASIVCKQATYADEIEMYTIQADCLAKNRVEADAKGGLLTKQEFQRQYFRAKIYPKVAACSSGEWIPTVEEAIAMPAVEFNRWYLAAHKTNPIWFDEFRELTEAAIKVISQLPASDPRYEALKKKEQKPEESSKSSESP